jgi:hypothetical protein
MMEQYHPPQSTDPIKRDKEPTALDRPGPDWLWPRPILLTAIPGSLGIPAAEINPASVRLQGVPVLTWGVADVTTFVVARSPLCSCPELGPDGTPDFLARFDHNDIIATLGNVEAGQVVTLTLTFQTLGGDSYAAVDSAVVFYSDAPIGRIEPTLDPNFPNPFNPATEIRFTLPAQAKAKLEIFNVLGQQVAKLVDEVLLPGDHRYRWDASHNASGIYLYRLTVDDFVATRKMVLLK